jgi:hypothetical protein
VHRAMAKGEWRGEHLTVSYPGRWHHHRKAFIQAMVPLLRKIYAPEEIRRVIARVKS